MRRATLVVALGLAVIVFFLVRQRWALEKEPQHNLKDVARVEPSPVTPWRNPVHDLHVLFPPATNAMLDARVVSGWTVQIQKQLGRLMHPDENPLRIQRVHHDGQTLGSILVTRVKAAHGGIEIVIGVETNGALRGVLIQSHREPPIVASTITNSAWLKSFAGKTTKSPLRLGTDLPDVPAEARASAEAIAAGVRDQLTVLTFAEMNREARELGRLPHN
ncbi:MAG TPA: hypothetical protein VK530_21185 [Candidatus Acidoferrum sp.]|nr:hypothetical protein [Candidatus Acidoferrum sp.]